MLKQTQTMTPFFLHLRYEVAALTFDHCYCGGPQQLHGLMVRASSTRSLEVRGENERQRWDRETPSTLKFTYIFKECADQKKIFTIFFILLAF